MIVSVDPGHSGGAVLLDGRGTPVAWWSWRPLERKTGRVYALDSATLSRVLDRFHLRTLAGVGSVLAEYVVDLTGGHAVHLAVEGLFVHPRLAGRGGAAIELGRTVGWLTAGLREAALSYEEPRSAVWRPAVLGPGSNTSSDIAEALAGQLWRSRWTGAPVESPHVHEAFGIGWWRHTRRAA